MSISDWGSIGELLAAVATVITLIYLALQLRNNSKVVRAQTYEQRTNHLREMNTVTMNSDWYWQVLEKLDQHLPGSTHAFGINTEATVEDWRDALAQLTFEEHGRFYVFALTQWNHLQNRAFQYEEGYDTKNAYDGFKWLAARQANMYEALGITSVGEGTMNDVVSKAVTHRGL